MARTGTGADWQGRPPMGCGGRVSSLVEWRVGRSNFVPPSPTTTPSRRHSQTTNHHLAVHPSRNIPDDNARLTRQKPRLFLSSPARPDTRSILVLYCIPGISVGFFSPFSRALPLSSLSRLQCLDAVGGLPSRASRAPARSLSSTSSPLFEPAAFSAAMWSPCGRDANGAGGGVAAQGGTEEGGGVAQDWAGSRRREAMG